MIQVKSDEITDVETQIENSNLLGNNDKIKSTKANKMSLIVVNGNNCTINNCCFKNSTGSGVCFQPKIEGDVVRGGKATNITGFFNSRDVGLFLA